MSQTVPVVRGSPAVVQRLASALTIEDGGFGMMRKTAPRFRLEQRRSIPLFSGCSDRELATIDGLVDDYEAASGAVLAQKGTPARQAFVIVSGTAIVEIDGVVIATLGAGDSFGEMALLSRPVGVRSATVTATSDMHLLVLEPRSFSALMETPSVAKKLLGDLSDRLRATDEMAAQR
jgi:CRP/FNR family transcriptional regulator, cyclic AMP receptor protein